MPPTQVEPSVSVHAPQTSETTTPNPLLNYYSSHHIIPVRQDITDLSHHFARREALYRHLRMLPSTFQGRHILEFGPGAGDDAVHTSSYQPNHYVMVDANPSSIKAIKQKIQSGQLAKTTECVEMDIMNFEDARQFDVVLAEGIVPAQKNATHFLQYISRFVAPKGILMVTTHSASSLLAEACRRLLKPILAQTIQDKESMIAACLAIVSPHLATLKGMNRLHEDWVLDTILHPWHSEVAFTLPMAVAALDNSFDVLGTSPDFSQDWRWYKSIPTHSDSINNIVLKAYQHWGAFFLDYRVTPDQVGAISEDISQIEALCEQALTIHFNIWEHNDVACIQNFLDILANIADHLRPFFSITAHSIDDYIIAIQQMLSGHLSPDFKSFASWFGRGQQYVSFIQHKLGHLNPH